jgi:hypothetical protein
LLEPRRSEPDYADPRYVEELRGYEEHAFRRREREAEDYIDSRLDGRRPHIERPHIERRHADIYDRRASPVIWTNRQPFSRTYLRHQYPPSSIDSAGW